MAAMADIPSNNWSAGLYYKRKYEEHLAREREEKAKREVDVIDADYVVISDAALPSPPVQGGDR